MVLWRLAARRQGGDRLILRAAVFPDHDADADQVRDVGHRFALAQLRPVQFLRPGEGIAVAGCDQHGVLGDSANLAVPRTRVGTPTGAGGAVFGREELNVASNLAVARPGVAGAAWAGGAVVGGDQQRVGLGEHRCRKDRERPRHQRYAAAPILTH